MIILRQLARSNRHPSSRNRRRQHPKLSPLFASSLLVINMLFSSVTPPPSANASGCDDLKVIFARGSGESLGDTSVQAWQKEIDAQLRTSNLTYSFYELGSATQDGSRYPAVAVSGSTDGFLALLGAVLSAGTAYDFGNSVTAGVNELKSYLTAVGRACPATKFILGGYSQGAMVMSRLLPELDPERIVYVATFGDPKLYLPEGAGLPSAACLGHAVSSYRAYVPDCQAYLGVLGGYKPYEPAGFAGKLGTWCNQDDIMCSSGWSLSDHTAYVSSQLYYDAAIKIRHAIQASFPTAWASSSTPTAHDLVLLFDTTISMSNMINSYRAEAKRLAAEVYQRGGRVAFYEFRDLQYDGSPQLRCDFTCDQDTLEQALDRITVGGGGDIPESALSASLLAMNTLKWRPNVQKTIVLLTDSDYLNPDRDGTTLAEVVKRSLEIDPVNFYVIVNYYKTADAYAILAQSTGGDVFYLQDASLATASILNRPFVSLPVSSYKGQVNDVFRFAVSNPDTTLRYDWDLDGDGEFEVQNQSSVNHTYASEWSGYIQVRATDLAGYSGTMSAHVTVLNSLPNPAKINAATLQYSSHTAQVSVDTAHTAKLLIIIDDTILGFINPSTHPTFTITDIELGTRITLVPYNSAGQRGDSVELSLSEAQSSSNSAQNQTLFIPNAPNAGAIDSG